MDILANQTGDGIRNVCILAHVDHGKTTLADDLLATNGFISAKSAGKLRFLDDRADEQERGITMKSSAIALTYTKLPDKTQGGSETFEGHYVINLVDSPGHIDFSREVLTAARLCDGALVLVDVVEGVCAQTTAALRCVWDEQLSAILVLNKIDRLFTELKMTATQAYYRLRQVLEQVNAVCADFFLRNSVFSDATAVEQQNGNHGNDALDDTNCYFEAHRNVVFASAIDSWAFTLRDFSRLYATRLGIDERELLDRFWNDAFYSANEKKIVDGASDRGRKPLFVQFALDNIASVYEAVIARDNQRVPRIISSLNLTVKPQQLKCLTKDSSSDTRKGRSANDTALDSMNNELRNLLRTIMGSWLPLAGCVFDGIIRTLPSPTKLSTTRFADWFATNTGSEYESAAEALRSCDAKNSKVVAFITKLVCMPHLRTDLAHDNEKKNSDLLAITRVYSGTLCEGQTVHVIDRKLKTRQASIQRIYVLRGRDLLPITQAKAGMVVGLTGFGDSVIKNATISNCESIPPIEYGKSGTRRNLGEEMVMRVGLEPTRAAEKNTLDEALERLVRVDPEARVRMEPSGETVLCAAGEVHLEKCIYDLRNSYCPTVGFSVSPIRVPFREVLVATNDSVPWRSDRHDNGFDSPATFNNEANDDRDSLECESVSIGSKSDRSHVRNLIELLRDKKRIVEASTAGGDCRIRVQASPLPSSVVETIEKHSALVRLLQSATKRSVLNRIDSTVRQQLVEFRESLRAAFAAANWPKQLADRLLAFGPREARCNLLVNATTVEKSVWHAAQIEEAATNEQLDTGSLIHGFQLACRSGPICGEPIANVCFFLFSCTKRSDTLQTPDTGVEAARFGQLIASMKQACTRAFSVRGGNVQRRLMLAMYVATVYTQYDQLGKVYAVLGRRFAKIVSESEACSSSVLCVEALIPVVESVGFAEELRRQTHGFASPSLRLTNWQVLDEDVEIVSDDLESDGQEREREPEKDADELYAAIMNRARRYVNEVRRRKGMQTDEQLVVHAEKQMNLSKKK